MIGRTDHDVDRMMRIVLPSDTEFCEVNSTDVILVPVPGHWEIMTKYGRIYTAHILTVPVVCHFIISIVTSTASNFFITFKLTQKMCITSKLSPNLSTNKKPQFQIALGPVLPLA